jgi:hypothetical protein
MMDTTLERTERRGDVERPLRGPRGELWVIIGIVAEIAFGTAASISTNRVETRQRGEIAKLERTLAWRALTGNQQAELISAMQLFKDQRIDIFSYNSDAEGEAFADQFIDVFKRARMDPASGKVATYSKLVFGVRLEIGSPNQELSGNGNINFVVRMPLTPTAQKASEVLASVLLHEKLIAEAPVPMIPKAFEGMDLPGLVPMSEAPIRLMIGVKPRGG